MNRLAMVMVTIIVMMMTVPAATAADGTCEVDGEVGLSTVWGECITPSIYDELFSYENLSTIPSLTSDQSIAAEVGMVDDTPSERQLGGGVLKETRTFHDVLDQFIYWHHMAGPR